MNKMIGALLPISLIFLWSLGTYSGIIDPLFLSAPHEVVYQLWIGLFSDDPELAEHLGVTILRSIAGFVLSVAVGVPLGLLIGRIKWLADACQPTIDFFRSVPASALFPLFLFMFGTGDLAKIMVVIYAASLIVLVNTAYGAMQVRNSRLLAAKVMGASKIQAFWSIVLPESMPGIFAGLRIALSMSFVLIIVTEMFIGTNVGLGYYIINAQMVYRIPEMYAGIVLAGMVGYFANILLLSVEKKALHWVGK